MDSATEALLREFTKLDPATEALLREFTKVDEQIWEIHREMVREAGRIMLMLLGRVS